MLSVYIVYTDNMLLHRIASNQSTSEYNAIYNRWMILRQNQNTILSNRIQFCPTEYNSVGQNCTLSTELYSVQQNCILSTEFVMLQTAPHMPVVWHTFRFCNYLKIYIHKRSYRKNGKQLLTILRHIVVILSLYIYIWELTYVV